MRCRDERGVVAIIVAILFPVILFSFAVVLDIGCLFLTKRQLQAVADAAALAGASCFEVTGELRGDSWVSVVKIMPSAEEEAERSMQFGAEDFEFNTRGIVVEDVQSGIGTDTYFVELTAEVPTMLVGVLHSLVDGGDTYDSVMVFVMSEATVDINM